MSENASTINDTTMSEEKALQHLKRWRRKLATKMDQVVDGLWLGSLRDAMDVERIADHNISAIVSVLDFRSDSVMQNANVKHLFIHLSDSPEQDALAHFSEVNSFIHSVRLQGKQVLVHCLAGVSRSVCFVVAYLMTVIPTLTYTTALTFVNSKRLGANPNFGFRMQLRKFGEDLIFDEYRRLRAEFLNDSQIFDELQVRDCSDTNSLHLKELSPPPNN